MKIALATLNYNLPIYTNKLICQADNVFDETFVIDNGSKFKPLKITHQIGKNCGYAAAFNEFLSWVSNNDKKWDYLFLTHNDVEILFDRDNIINVLSGLHGVGCVSPSLIGSSSVHMSHSIYMSAVVKEVKYVDGAFMGMSRAFLDKRPTMPVESFFGMGCDIDMGLMASQFGFKNYVINSCKVYHYGNTTVKEAPYAINSDSFWKTSRLELDQVMKKRWGIHWVEMLL